MGDKYGSETGVYEMDLAGKVCDCVKKIPPWNSSSCDPLCAAPAEIREAANSIGATGYLRPNKISGRWNTLVRPALNRSNVQEYLAVMSQMAPIGEEMG
jgi:hypothetical protein